MGTLEGHLMPGVGFLLYSLYYSVLTSLALLREQKVLKHPMLPRKLCGHRLLPQVSYEALIKVLMGTLAVVCELFYPPGENRLQMIDWKDPRRPFIFKDNWQHVTMFGFFAFSGVVDLVSQSRLVRSWGEKLEHAAEALAFYVLVVLMATHTENKSSLEIRVHLLLMVPSFLLALVTTVEVWLPNHPPIWILKCLLGLVFSNWLFQICEMYVPLTGQPWRSDSPADRAFLSVFFCWYIAFSIALFIAVYGLCSLWHCHYSSWKKTPGARYQRCRIESSCEELEKLKAEALLQDGVV
ncbi:transmembrane epididymal protein 1A [Cricetulus griseus]|uniref:Transmembrane epididymal family member 3 n=1 Tax=Cricetulus griseus TaxID=10029 RepID=G3I8W5_CRIGR|nr:transmembrane epididymal protein 1A [Cricetulus griseus]EGW14707.1 Transmembrane epididymal protein 1 [Cricetulus griseus]